MSFKILAWKSLVILLILVLIHPLAMASGEDDIKLEWPKIDYRIDSGDNFKSTEPVGCYSLDGLRNIRIWQEFCKSWRSEARECKELCSDMAEPPDWYESIWFYLAAGLIVGLGTSAAIVMVD